MNKGRLFEVKTHYPQIYVFEDHAYPDWLKVGFTTRQNAEERVRKIIGPRLQLDKNAYTLYHVEDAIDKYGKEFMDHDVHDRLVSRGVRRQGEYFKTDIDTVRSAILAVKENRFDIEDRTETFSMRDEQTQAVKQTKEYFRDSFEKYPNSKPKYLWNAKMRFGKTFAAYQLAKQMDFKRVLVLTYKPAVEDSWKSDLLSHMDFEGWQFISRKEDNIDSLDSSKPFVYFASFQDMLGTQNDGALKKHNEWIHSEDWDIIIQDEYHYGAWRDSAKELLESDYSEKVIDEDKDAEDLIDGKCLLYLSGTPFKAIDSGEFIEDQVFNWTYADEQKAKAGYVGKDSPYEALPEMNIYTYELSEDLKRVAMRGEANEFSLSYFFKAEGNYENSKFINEGDVQRWLNFIEGRYETEVDIIQDVKSRGSKTKLDTPFSRSGEFERIHKELKHMLWLLPSVSSVYAMKNLLEDPINKFFNSFDVIVAAGDKTGSGTRALEPVREAMGENPMKTKTITLSCGKLTTGVTVPPWTGIFMLRTLNSPESYFQSAFRVQSPWITKDEHGNADVLKKKCYVFDFDPTRALGQVHNYVSRLDTRSVSIKEKVGEFIKYLPILAYSGNKMKKINATELLDISTSGTSSTYLASRWNNSTALNLESEMIEKIINDDELLEIINSIVSFRKKGTPEPDNNPIKPIVTKGGTDDEDKKAYDEYDKKLDKERDLIKNKLTTLATRIPVFMYLTDYREEQLTDVIRKIEPGLFKKVTEITLDDFELLMNAGVFNSRLMNDSIYKFRRYEDSSISYTGINRHKNDVVIGGFDEVRDISKDIVNKPYIPFDERYFDSKIYFTGSKFTLYRGSKHLDEDNSYVETEKDFHFDRLEDAADFISNGKNSDWTFFNL